VAIKIFGVAGLVFLQAGCIYLDITDGIRGFLSTLEVF